MKMKQENNLTKRTLEIGLIMKPEYKKAIGVLIIFLLGLIGGLVSPL